MVSARSLLPLFPLREERAGERRRFFGFAPLSPLVPRGERETNRTSVQPTTLSQALPSCWGNQVHSPKSFYRKDGKGRSAMGILRHRFVFAWPKKHLKFWRLDLVRVCRTVAGRVGGALGCLRAGRWTTTQWIGPIGYSTTHRKRPCLNYSCKARAFGPCAAYGLLSPAPMLKSISLRGEPCA